MSRATVRLPAEWEPHDSTLIAWTANKKDWPGKFTPIQWVYGEIVRKISIGERVRIIVQSKKQQKQAERALLKVGTDLSKVQFLILQTDRGWVRDASPVFVKRKNKIEAVHFQFNGWAKYNNWKKDKKISPFLAMQLGLNLIEAEQNNRHIVLEGGAIDSNGCGTLLTTEECLLDEKTQIRNPGFSKSDYEKIFKQYLGITNTIWLGKGIAGDDTHGHVDDLCRFVNKDTVVLCREKNKIDENYFLLEENFERLQNEKLEDGSKVKVVSLPMPSPLMFDGMRLPASYANFYIANEVVLVPTFNDPNDRIALGILADFFPEREVVGIHAVDLVWGLGTL
ncbi:MAG: agmatine deiminase family protein, partial [Ignavibacteriaceae bacterium]